MRRRSIPVGLWVVLVAGLAIRLWAMRWPPFPIDMGDWIAWGERVLTVGPWNFYAPNVFSDYAPGYVYVMGLTAAIKNGLFPGAGLGVYHFMYRIVPVVCDLVTGVLIYRVLEHEERPAPAALTTGAVPLALAGAAAHVFNPAIIFNSATWGQIDGTFTLAMLLSVVLVLRDRPVWSVVSYVVAFMIKPQAISLAPVLGLALLLRYPPRHWLTAGAVGLALGWLISAPFLGLNAYVRLVQLLGGSVETYPYTSLFTYNIWGIYGMWKDDRVPLWLGLSVRATGQLLYIGGLALGAALLLYRLRRSRDDLPTLWAFGAYFTMLPVMVLTRMHERYLYPVLPFVLVAAMVYAIRRLRPTASRPRGWPLAVAPLLVFGVLAVLHTLNLYHVYTYYQNYDTGVPRDNALFYFIDRNARLWSALTLALFAGLTAALARWVFVRPAAPVAAPAVEPAG